MWSIFIVCRGCRQKDRVQCWFRCGSGNFSNGGMTGHRHGKAKDIRLTSARKSKTLFGMTLNMWRTYGPSIITMIMRNWFPTGWRSLNAFMPFLTIKGIQQCGPFWCGAVLAWMTSWIFMKIPRCARRLSHAFVQLRRCGRCGPSLTGLSNCVVFSLLNDLTYIWMPCVMISVIGRSLNPFQTALANSLRSWMLCSLLV